MKRLFATFICLFAISFCFAEKVEFVADNGKEMGEIEFASENGVKYRIKKITMNQ